MNKLIAFFEIPAKDFHRAIRFYETVLDIQLSPFEWEEEKMAFFKEGDETAGAISYASGFLPSKDGTLIHFNCKNIEHTLKKVLQNGGEVIIPMTKIECEDKGYFAVFLDSEGNRIGIYADN